MTSMPRALASAISATLVRPAVDGDDERGAAGRPRRRSPPATARGPRRAGSARTARRRRRTGAARRVMIASPVSPSASKSPKTMTRSPRSRAACSRARTTPHPAGGRVVQAIERIGEPGDQRLRAVEDAAGRPGAPPARPRPGSAASAATSRGRGDERPGRSSGSGVRPRRQDATRGCTADLPAGCVVRLRTPCAGLAGCGSW